MIVLDAGVLISHYGGTEAHHQRATDMLLEHAEDGVAASSVTLAEVLVGPARAHRLDQALGRLQADGVQELPLPVDAAVRLAALRASTDLKLPDCCVLVAAQGCLASAVATFDVRLAVAARQLGFQVAGID